MLQVGIKYSVNDIINNVINDCALKRTDAGGRVALTSFSYAYFTHIAASWHTHTN